MKRVFLGSLLFVMLFVVSACTGKDSSLNTHLFYYIKNP